MVTVALDEIELQRHLRAGGGIANKLHESAIGQRRRVVEEDAGSAAEPHLGFLGPAREHVAGDAAFDRDPELRFDDVCGGVRSEERRVGEEGRSRWSPYH